MVLKIIIGIVVLFAVLTVLGKILPAPKPPAAGTIVTLPDGKMVNTFTRGEGADIVLIHGLPGSVHDWPELVDALVGKGFRVTWYDRVGYGHSSRRAEGAAFTMHENARELDALIMAMELDNPALVGWSFGGGVVQSSATARKAETPFIVLLAAVGPSMKIEGARDDMKAAEWAMRLPLLGGMLTKVSISARFAEKMPDSWVSNQRSLMLMPGTLDTFRGEMNGLTPSDLSPSDIKTRTLIIHGTKDPMVPYKVGVNLSEIIEGAKLLPIEGIGHMIPLSHPAEIADAITAFSKETSGE